VTAAKINTALKEKPLYEKANENLVRLFTFPVSGLFRELDKVKGLTLPANKPITNHRPKSI